MNPENAGNAMMFFAYYIGAFILSLYVAAYSAHICLITIDTTASGSDEVAWPDEPYVDWVWKLVYVVWMIAIWLVPIYFFAQSKLRENPTSSQVATVIIIGVIAAWMISPVTMLSSMGAPSHWFLIYPPVLRRMAAHPPAIIQFYLQSGPALAIIGFSLAMLVYWPPFALVLAGAIGLTIGLLIYSRLIGKLALAISEVIVKPTKATQAAKSRRTPPVKSKVRDPWAADEFLQPDQLPEVNAPNPEARRGYNLKVGEETQGNDAPRPPAPRPVDLAEGEYILADIDSHDPAERGPLPAQWAEPSEHEMKLLKVNRQERRPEEAPLGGAWDFPFRATNVGVATWLTLGFAVAGTFVRMAIMTSPR